MKKTIVLLALVSLLAVSLAMAKGGPFTLTSCTDSDGDDPMSPGMTEWADADAAGDETGGGKTGDVCSAIHYLNVMLYAGESFRWGEAVLVEGVCPAAGTAADEPGDLPVMKYYKCKCENQGGAGEKGTEGSIGVCTGPAEEIPYEKVKAADEKWGGKKDLNPWLARFLKLMGIWG